MKARSTRSSASRIVIRTRRIFSCTRPKQTDSRTASPKHRQYKVSIHHATRAASGSTAAILAEFDRTQMPPAHRRRTAYLLKRAGFMAHLGYSGSFYSRRKNLPFHFFCDIQYNHRPRGHEENLWCREYKNNEPSFEGFFCVQKSAKAPYRRIP